MASLHISLPDALREWVDSLIEGGDYSTPSEYLRELIRIDQRRKAEERLDALLLEGFSSGAPEEATDEYWERMKSRLEGRMKKKAG